MGFWSNIIESIREGDEREMRREADEHEQVRRALDRSLSYPVGSQQAEAAEQEAREHYRLMSPSAIIFGTPIFRRKG